MWSKKNVTENILNFAFRKYNMLFYYFIRACQEILQILSQTIYEF